MAEQACLLGSMNLSEYVFDGKFDMITFCSDVKTCVTALNEALDESIPLQPLPEQSKMARDWRAIGLGIMGLGDCLIKLKLKYGSKEANDFISEVMLWMAFNAIYQSAMEAKKHGKFRECKDNNWILRTPYFKNIIEDKRVGKDQKEMLYDIVKEYGLRNCQIMTVPPTGSIATMIDTSGGLEPLFSTHYTRKTESLGDGDHYYEVYPKVIKELIDEGYTLDSLPEYVVTAHDIPWRERIETQATIQKFVDVSLSSTCNLNESVTWEEIRDLYIYAWQLGLKGCTVFRNNCKRLGILTTGTKHNEAQVVNNRPDVLDAKLVRFKNNDENWIAFIGLMNDKPYEIFTGKTDCDEFPIPTSVTEGKILKVKTETEKRYDFQYKDKYGYVNTLGGLSRIFNKEYWNYAKLISALLRGNIEIDKVIKIIDGLNLESDTLNTWKNGIKRALKQFVADGTVSYEKCPECGEPLIYTNGCAQCPSCGFSKCS